MFGRTTRLLAASVTLALVGLAGGAGAQSASARSFSNDYGSMKVSKVTGEARNGATFAGAYKVNRFVTTSSGKTKAVGKLTGTVTKKNGKTEKVTEKNVRMRVLVNKSSVSGAPAAEGARSTSAEGCDILNLVLGPLDLDLLGLNISLNQVVLDIVAVPGAGNLLGNLLCAVAGLLDGTQIAGLGAILTNLLNAILGILQA